MTNLNFSFFSKICRRTMFSKNSVDSLLMTRNYKLIGKHMGGGHKKTKHHMTMDTKFIKNFLKMRYYIRKYHENNNPMRIV